MAREQQWQHIIVQETTYIKQRRDLEYLRTCGLDLQPANSAHI